MVLLSYYYSIIMKGAKVAINSRSNLINHKWGQKGSMVSQYMLAPSHIHRLANTIIKSRINNTIP